MSAEDHAQRQGPLRMSSEEYDDLWRCAICRTWHVVPSLARDCERRCAGR